MTDYAALTHAFIERHPASAARVLLAADANEAADFMNGVPPKLAARLLTQAGPWPAARVLLPMKAEAAAAVLQELQDVDAAAILRLIDERDRAQLLDQLAADLRRQLASSLDYPADAVGARMTTSILMVDGETTASAALDLVRSARVGLADVVFVIDPGSQVQGAVSVATLLQAPATEVIAALVDTGFPFVSARTSLQAAADEGVWGDYPAVGVVDSQRRLIGALTRSALDLASADGTRRPAQAPDSLLGSVSGAMLDSINGLWTLFGDRGAGSQNRQGDR